MVVLSWLTLIGSAENQKRELISAVQRTMQAVVTAVDAELDVSLSALDTLANSSRLKTGDLAAFHAEARELMARRPNWANVVLSTPEAQQLVNARLPFGAQLPSRVAPDTIAEVAASNRPLVGHVLTSPLLKKPSFAVLVPVRLEGDPGPKYVLSAPIWPSSIQNLLYKQGIPEKSVVSILDRNFNIVARTLNQSELVGKPASPTLRKLLATGKTEGWAITTTLEGTEVYTIYKRSPSSGWTAVVGIPLDVLDNPVRHSYRLLAGSIVLAALLGVAVSLAFARSITRPMRELQLAAGAVGRGEAPAIPDTDIPEIRQVGQAMAGAYSERERLLASEREAHLHEREARLQAEQANRAKDEFVAMLGHELRNPLAPIYTAAQLLKLPGADPARVRQLSAIVERQAGHLTRLVDDILDVSRVTRKVIVLNRETLDMNAIVPQAVEQVQELVTARNHKLDVLPSGRPAWVDADRTRMVQVLVNLLHNAAKYTPDGGRIVLRTVVDGDKVRVTVADNGAGIPPSLLPRIFDLFAQAERTLDRAQGGLGLGLPLARGLVELHGGTIEALSAGPGQG
ncbi:MAG TPA: sensor histidine kinase, partial [Telluria sp.]|nr:sensor histidine kinase [Telluria sp.]